MSAADNNRGGNKAVLPPWMLTFADLMSLLLTFFVLLFSMSQIKVESWQAVVESLSQQRDPFSSAAESRPDADRNMPKEIEPRTYDLGYLETVIGEKLRSDPVLANSIVQRIGNRLIVSLSSDMLFDDNDAKLTQPAKQATFVLGNVLRTVGNAIEVDGHTDPKPVVGRSSYPSQWELTLSRAARWRRRCVPRAIADRSPHTDMPIRDSRISRPTCRSRGAIGWRDGSMW